MGDGVITRQAMTDARHKKLGTLNTDCKNIGTKAQVFKAALQCVTTHRFADGEIVAAGVATISDPKASFPILGGSGAYTGASGTIPPANLPAIDYAQRGLWYLGRFREPPANRQDPAFAGLYEG